MTETDRALIAVMKWVVNPLLPAPELTAIDEAALTDLLLYHRIVQPFLSRLETGRPRWVSAGLPVRLRFLQQHIRTRTRQQIAAAREITQAMQASDQPAPIFVKGFAAYALTGDPNLLYQSGDLDPFAADLPAFWEVLHSMGYHGKRKETHEWAKLSRGDITLDVHQHFPVLSYPPEVRIAPADRLSAARNTGRWSLSVQAPGLIPTREPIQWSDLVGDAKPGVAEGTEELQFPSPEMLCLIHCAHCFRSTVTRQHYLNPLGGFRLYEFLSLRTLARLPNFDKARFRSLKDRFEATDAVNLVNRLSLEILGEAAVPGDDTEPMQTYPEHLSFGGWVSLQHTDDWFLKRGLPQILHQMGANTLPNPFSAGTDTIERVLRSGNDPPTSLLSLEWRPMEDCLALRWEFSENDRYPYGREFLIHFGVDSSVRVQQSRSGEISEVLQKSDYWLPEQKAAAVSEGQGSIVRVLCPVPQIPPSVSGPADDELPLFLAVRRLQEDGSTDAVTYLPVRLQRTI
jgi:hypothetical protein